LSFFFDFIRAFRGFVGRFIYNLLRGPFDLMGRGLGRFRRRLPGVLGGLAGFLARVLYGMARVLYILICGLRRRRYQC
jgi:hypothetical protein